jgi:hypothetical protein
MLLAVLRGLELAGKADWPSTGSMLLAVLRGLELAGKADWPSTGSMLLAVLRGLELAGKADWSSTASMLLAVRRGLELAGKADWSSTVSMLLAVLRGLELAGKAKSTAEFIAKSTAAATIESSNGLLLLLRLPLPTALDGAPPPSPLSTGDGAVDSRILSDRAVGTAGNALAFCRLRVGG